MKRIFVLLLALTLLLLCACNENTVPVYTPAETEVPTESTAPLETTEAVQPDQVYTPKGERLIRLSQTYYMGDQYYIAENTLNFYDAKEDRSRPLCSKKNCPHVDENCNAWLGLNRAGLFFAVDGDLLYCVSGNTNEVGNHTDLEFFTVNLATGERRSYYTIEEKEDQQIILCDAVICGEQAILNFDIAAGYRIGEVVYGKPVEEKEHFILSFQLDSGEMTTVMQRSMEWDGLYDLWAVNDSHLILAYHHPNIGSSDSFGAQNYEDNYNNYAMRLHRWVLLEYPIAEEAPWSEQVAEYSAQSDLKLFSYSSFYEGRLYYVLNGDVRAYDLETHKRSNLFTQAGISYLCCYDGKIFFETYAEEYFYYDLSSGETVQIQKDSRMVFLPLGESEDYFYGIFTSAWEGGYTSSPHHYLISKADFYAENFDAAIRLPL